MKGIIFNLKTGLLKSVIYGRKTITRRTGGLNSVNYNPNKWNISHSINDESGLISVFFIDINKNNRVCCEPKYKVGEIIYIKESHQILDLHGKENIIYKVDYDVEFGKSKWSNTMQCSEKKSRHKIKILSVRVERMQDIIEEDCIKEGIRKLPFMGKYGGHSYENYMNTGQPYSHIGAKDSFASLIDKLSGKGTWDKNEWFWVYEYELLTETI